MIELSTANMPRSTRLRATSFLSSEHICCGRWIETISFCSGLKGIFLLLEKLEMTPQAKTFCSYQLRPSLTMVPRIDPSTKFIIFACNYFQMCARKNKNKRQKTFWFALSDDVTICSKTVHSAIDLIKTTYDFQFLRMYLYWRPQVRLNISYR